MQFRQRLGEILRESRRITEVQRTEALDFQARWNAQADAPTLSVMEASRAGRREPRRLGQVLVQLGHVTDIDAAWALAIQFGVEFVDLDLWGAISPDILKRVPREIIRAHTVLPLDERHGRLRVLVHDPVDVLLRDTLGLVLNRPVDFAVGVERQIKAFIQRELQDEVGGLPWGREAAVPSE